MVLEQECELCELNLITCIAIICTIYNLCESQDFTVSLLSAILLNCILFQQKHRFKWNLTQMTISFCHTGYPWSFFPAYFIAAIKSVIFINNFNNYFL